MNSLTPYFEEPEGVVYHGDCRNILPKLRPNAKLVLTSPPYNMGKGYTNWDDTMDEQNYSAFVSQCISLCLNTSTYVFWNMQWLTSTRGVIIDICFGKYKKHLKDLFVWKKNVKNTSKHRLAPGFEFVFLFGQDNKYEFQDNNFPSNWYVPNIQAWHKRNPDHDKHPATFCQELPEYFIKYFTHPGDLVIDPFMGVGTTLYTAKRLGRKYIGIDNSKECCACTVQNLKSIQPDRLTMSSMSNEINVPHPYMTHIRKNKRGATYIDGLLLEGKYTIDDIMNKVKGMFPDNKYLNQKGLDQHIRWLKNKRDWHVQTDPASGVIKAQYIPKKDVSAAGLVDFLILQGKYTHNDILREVHAKYPDNKYFKTKTAIVQHVKWKGTQHGWDIKIHDGIFKVVNL